METTNSLATFKATAQNLWETHQGALATISVQYVDLVNAKPKGSTVAELYSALPKQWQDRVTKASFEALFSKANGIVKMFAKAKDEGRMAKYPDARALVEFHGSLAKAEKVLRPAKVDPKDETPKVTKETKTETKTETKATAQVVDKFAQVCTLVDELNESDLKALQMLVADKIQKMQAKATTKV